MPSYEWRCPDCSQRWIERITIREYQLFNKILGMPMCVDCDKEMKRVFDATPAQFKGGGWAGKGN